MTSCADHAQDTSTSFLLVCGSTQPYVQFIPELLALPKGTNYHFRFREPWLPNDVWSNPSQLVGHHGYVVHLNQAEGRDEYLPIMRVWISSAIKLGEHVRIDFTVEELVQCKPRNTPGPNAQASRILGMYREASAPTGPRGHFVVRVRPDSFCLQNDDANWVNIARELCRFPTFIQSTGTNPTIFLRSSWTLAERTLPGRKGRMFDPGGHLQLDAGKSYRLRLLQYIPAQDANQRELQVDQSRLPVTLALDTDDDIVHSSVSSVEIRGKYDDVSLDVRCRPSVSASLTMVQVKSDAKGFVIPRVRFDNVEVKKSPHIWMAAGGAALMLMVGSLGAGIASVAHLSVGWGNVISAIASGLAAVVIVVVGATWK